MARLSVGAWVVALSLLPVACGQPDRSILVEVEAGVPRDLVLAPGTCQVVPVTLRPGEGLAFSLDQQGVDVLTTLVDPSGAEAIVFDSPVVDQGLDEGAWIAEHSGTHRLEICAGSAEQGGPYRLEVHYPITPDDRFRSRVEGYRAYARGKELGAEEDPAGARQAFEEAFGDWQAAGDVLPRAWASYWIGRTSWDLDALEEAGEAFERSASFFEEGGDARSRARASAWAGNAFQSARLYRGAVVAYPVARGAAASAGEVAIERNAVEGLARTFTELNEPLEALEHYGELLTEPRFDTGAEDRVRALRCEGLLYQDLGEAERALDLFESARDLAEREVVGSERGKVMLDLGGALLDLGRVEAAESLLVEARRVLAEQEDRVNLGWATSRLGRLYVQTGRFAEAGAMLDRALDLARSLGDKVMAGEIRINRGRLEASLGRHEAAVAVCQEALGDLSAADKRLWSASALNCLADNFTALGRLEEAQGAIEEAIGWIESVRRQPTPRQLRTALLADKHSYYGRLIEILLGREATSPGKGFAARAFEVAERSRSRTLLDEIERAKRELRSNADPTLLARSEALSETTARLEKRLLREDESKDAVATAALRRRLGELRAERDLVEGKIEAALPGPRLAEVSKAVDLKTVQHELLASGGTELVELYLGERTSVVWVLGPGGLKFARLPPGEVIERLARQASKLMAESHDRHKRVRARLAAEVLSEVILDPVVPWLTAPHLVIVADGALTGVSFAALPLEPDPEAPLLGERYEVTRLPSASVGVALRHREPIGAPRGRLAIVADPVFEPDDPRLHSGSRGAVPGAVAEARATVSVTRAAGLDRMDRLEASGREARAIAQFVPPTQRRVLLGFDADRSKVLRGAVSGFQVVHFATHGLVLGKLSGLVLSQVDDQGRPVDGFLRSWEVFDLGLDADLVVLSACRTGLGHYLPGEGVMGLSRAFLAAGSSQVLVSLWDVDDRATAALMERFYRAYLVDGHPPSRALREAQEWMRARPEWSAPHYWAGFVLQGEPR